MLRLFTGAFKADSEAESTVGLGRGGECPTSTGSATVALPLPVTAKSTGQRRQPLALAC